MCVVLQYHNFSDFLNMIWNRDLDCGVVDLSLLIGSWSMEVATEGRSKQKTGKRNETQHDVIQQRTQKLNVRRRRSEPGIVASKLRIAIFRHRLFFDSVLKGECARPLKRDETSCIMLLFRVLLVYIKAHLMRTLTWDFRIGTRKASVSFPCALPALGF